MAYCDLENKVKVKVFILPESTCHKQLFDPYCQSAPVDINELEPYPFCIGFNVKTELWPKIRRTDEK